MGFTSCTEGLAIKKRRNRNRTSEERKKQIEKKNMAASNWNFNSKRQLTSPEEATATTKKAKEAESTTTEIMEEQDTDTNEGSASIRDALMSTRMAIIPADYPDVIFTENMVSDIEDRILSCIDSLEGVEEAPTFLYRRYERGYFKLACVGEYTRGWLIKETANWKFFGRSVKVVPLSDLPQPPVYRAWIPGTKATAEKILSRLSKQNKGLNVAGWRLKNSFGTEKGFKAFFEVDPAGIEFLKTKNFLLFYGLTQIKFSLVTGNSGNADDNDKGSAVGNNSNPIKIAVDDPASNIKNNT